MMINRGIYTYTFAGRFKVQKHFAKQNGPAFFGMSIFHFGYPSLHRWLLIIPTEEQFGGISSLHVLQYANPVVHGRNRICRQIVNLFACVDFKCRRAIGTCYSTLVVQYDLPLRLSVDIILAFPVCECTIL